MMLDANSWLRGVRSLVALSLALSGSAALGGDSILDIYRLALASDPTYQAAEASYRAEIEFKPQSRGLLLPDVRLIADTTGNDEQVKADVTAQEHASYNSKGFDLTLTQPLYHHDYWAQLRQSNSVVAEAEADLAAAKNELILRVANAYFDVLRAEDNLEFAQSEKSAAARQHDQAKQRFEVGLTAITDVHEARAAYDLAVAEEIQAINDLSNAFEALRQITGQDHSAVQNLGPGMPLISPEPDDIDSWTETAQEYNLGLIARTNAVQAAREEVELQRGGHYPTFDVVARYTERDTGGRFGDSDTTRESISLQMELPIFEGGRVNSRIREAHARLDEARDLEEEQRRSVVQTSRDAYRRILSSISRVNALKQAETSTQVALEAIESGFKVGTRTIVDVLQAERSLFRSQRDHKAERYVYVQAYLALKDAAGSLSDEDMVAVDQWMDR